MLLVDATILEELKQSFPFLMNVRDFSRRHVKSRLNIRKDTIIGVTGDEGMGKSHFSIQCAKALDSGFKFSTHLLFQPNEQQVVAAIHGLPKQSAIIADEAIKIMYKRGYYDRIRILLNTIFATCRKAEKAAFLCMPNFDDFDVYYRQHRIWFWAHVVERGWVVLLEKSNNQFSKDKWNLALNLKTMDAVYQQKHTPQLDIEDYLEGISKTKNFRGVIYFDALPQVEEMEYLALAAEEEKKWLEANMSGNGAVEESATFRRVNEASGRLMSALLDLGKSQAEIVQITGMSAAWVNIQLARVKGRKIDKVNFDSRSFGGNAV